MSQRNRGDPPRRDRGDPSRHLPPLPPTPAPDNRRQDQARGHRVLNPNIMLGTTEDPIQPIYANRPRRILNPNALPEAAPNAPQHAPPERGYDSAGLGSAYSQHHPPPLIGALASNPSARGTALAVTETFDGMSLHPSVEARRNPYLLGDDRERRLHDFVPPPPFSHPPPSEQSQPHPSAQSRRGASSTHQDIHPRSFEPTDLHHSGLPRRVASSSQQDLPPLLPKKSQPHPSGRPKGGHKPPSPPEEAGQAKRRKRTTTSGVTSSLQEEEAPEGDHTLLGEPPVPTRWWTQDEDDALKKIKAEVPPKKNKAIDWETISRNLRKKGFDRSQEACTKHWNKDLAGSESTPRPPNWTKEEDDKLTELVSKIRYTLSSKDWENISAEVSQLVVHRPPGGCRTRWTELERRRKRGMRSE